MTDIDLSFVDEIIKQTGPEPAQVIPILQKLQNQYGYLPESALRRVCEISQITPAAIAGVSTFYSQFRHSPVGRHLISVCVGTACHVKGADLVYDAVRRHLNLKNRQDTDPDKLFTVQKVACLGCCTLAPAVQIDQVTYGHLTAHTVGHIVRDFLELQKQQTRQKTKKTPAPPPDGNGEIRIGLGSCCVSRGSGKLNDALKQALADTNIPVAVKRVGCVGMCHQTPLLEIVQPSGRSFLYARVQPQDARAIVLRHFKPKSLTQRISNKVSLWFDHLLTDQHWPPVTRCAIDVRDQPVSAFLGKQINIATECCGEIDPTNLDEYQNHRGFEALKHGLSDLTPDRIIEQITQSNLRGRGGAGYPTGLKWSHVKNESATQKYVICNGDEGDPGAFMDRMLLESYPYRVIEGILIAAYAVGASHGIFYIRDEYPLAVKRVREALDICRQNGLLGNRILGKNFNFDLRIMKGAGAFVCGEESALIASIEGRRGMPRLRPPYPAQQGLWGRPTLVNNVETFALVPWIIRNHPERFAQLGTPKSAGTKVFALAGKIARGGLIEVPMGITLREIVEDVGGGIAHGKRFKAVQVGGPSGGCVPAELADTTVDYEALTAAGAIMGSGGLVVLDETDCMVDIARYFLEFTQNQSCGRCTFCRIGTRRMLDVLDRLCAGDGQPGDLEELHDLAVMIKKSSLCALGGTAPNPVLSTLRHFRAEYQAHLEKRCPAGKCRALITYSITEDCIGCTLCARQCPADAIPFTPYVTHEINVEKCVRCGTCREVCPADAVKVE